MRQIILLLLALLASSAAAAQSIGGAFAVIGGDNPPISTVPVYTNDFTTTCAAPGFTFTRASAGWDYNAAGTLASYASNVPICPAYANGGPTNNGIGLWAARTNTCLNSTAPANQSISEIAGTWNISVQGSGSMSAATSGMFVRGTTSAAIVSGATSIPLLFIPNGLVNGAASSGNAGITDGTTITLAGLTLTLSAPTTAAIGNNVALNFTALTGTATQTAPFVANVPSAKTVALTKTGTLTGLNCERTAGTAQTFGAASPPIVTSTTTVTRAADFMSAPLSSLHMPSDRGTVLVAFMIPAINNPTGTLFSVSDGTLNNSVTLALSPATRHLTVTLTVGGVSNTTASILSDLPLGVPHVVGVTYNRQQIAISQDGQTTRTGAVTTSLPSFSTLALGANSAAANNMMGYVAKLTLYQDAVGPSFLAALTSPPVPVPVSGLDIQVVEGQSNGYGSYATPDLTTSPPYPTQALMVNDYWNIHGSGTTRYTLVPPSITGFIAAVENLHPTPPCNATTGNCGESLSTSMMAQEIFMGSTSTYVARNASAAGNMIDEISKPNAPYSNGLGAVADINARAVAAGRTSKNSVVTFVHGTTDALAGTDPASYCSQLATLQSDWKTDVTAVTHQSLAPKFIVMQMPAINSGVSSYIQQCQLALTISAPTEFLLGGPSYMFPLNPNAGPHYANTSQQFQGEMAAKCAYDQFFGAGCKGLYPTAIAFKTGDKSKIELTFSVPVAPIVEDLVGIPQGAAPFDGFWFVDDCRSAHVTGAAITGASTVEVSLSAVSSCGHPFVSYAMTGEPGVNADQPQQRRPAISISNSGSGGTDGLCTVTLALDPSRAISQAKYNVNISGGQIASLATNPVQDYGKYSAATLGSNFDNVPVSGCGLAGATFSGVNIVIQPPAIINDVTLPTITGWDGITDGTGIVTVSIDAAGAYQQAQLAVTVVASVPTVTGIVTYGAWPLNDVSPPTYTRNYSNVPLTGMGVTLAQAQGVQLRQGIASDKFSGMWGNIHDSSPTISRLGHPLVKWLASFFEPVP